MRIERIAFALLVATACQQPRADQNDRESATNIQPGQQANNFIRIMKKQSGPVPLSAPAGAHLTYFGGPVISNAKIVQVLYGSGTYLSQISGAQMGNFYQQAMNSPYVDWLSEYDTNITASGGGPGTNQHIGRGSFAGQVQITPSAANGGTSLTNDQISAELLAQINAGHLPANDANTLYMINFPKGVSISLSGTPSCQAGGFCAYHNTVVRNGQDVFYGVLPDMSSGSGCDTGCGSDPSLFNNQTSVASHEMVEAITDSAVGLATTSGPPLAWYDNTNGEIGDICNAQQGQFVGSDGVTYTVQLEFSNQANDCILSKSTQPPPDAGTAPDSGTTPPDSGPPPPPPDAGVADSGTGGGTCSHPICSAGGALTSSCDPCAGQVCSADPYCCATQWDNICVGEVSSICGQSCSGGTPDAGVADSGTGGGGSCAHPICSTGKKLDPSCDSCAGQICSIDSYCCTVKWDSICKSEVGSICGQSCP